MTGSRGWVLSLLALLVSLGCWAMASPVGSAPDDDLHIANISCLHDANTCRSADWQWPRPTRYWPVEVDDRAGTVFESAQAAYPDLWAYPDPRELPCYIRNGSTWYAPDVTVAATCLNAEDPRNAQPASVDRLGYYPPFYYRVLSVFTQDTLRSSVVAWRMVNVVLAVVVLGVSIRLTTARNRRAVIGGALAVGVPAAMFLLASINPSSWLILAVIAAIGPGLALVTGGLRRRGTVTRAVFLLVCALLMLAGRTEGPFYLVVTTLTVLGLGLRVSRRKATVVAVLGAVAVVAVGAWIALTDDLKIRSTISVVVSAARQNPWDVLLLVPGDLVGQSLTLLGWNEAMTPAAVTVSVNIAVWGFVILGLASTSARKLCVLLVLLSGLLISALLLRNAGVAPPTRYVLPLVFLTVITAGLPTNRVPRWSVAQTTVIASAVAISNTLGLLYLTVRYVGGVRPGLNTPWDLAAAGLPQWWWGFWLSPVANWALGSVAFIVLLVVLATAGLRQRQFGYDEAVQTRPNVVVKGT